MLFGILGWLVLGLIVGFIASRAVNLRDDDPGIGIGIAALAAVLGGWMYGLFSASPIAAFNPWSLLFAAVAAVLALLIWHTWRARGSRA